ncbi:MAG: F0F1 ATP synthase subunit A [Prevotellaceae bacterium]|jgi:F-type H+-transporting ATPase subunit a|nr:F0F1 ATP synthase subunit A [Prevotellaceae bacterium]
MLIRRKFLTVVLLSLIGLNAYSNEEQHRTDTTESSQLDVTELILGHVSDGYMWHIATFKGHEIAIPLPVIVLSNSGEWSVFSSSRLEHGHAEYKGFYISKSEKYKGKIVEKDADGQEMRPFDFSITKNALSLIINSIILVLIILLCAKWYRNRNVENSNPKGFVAFIEMFVMMLVDSIIKPCIGANYRRYIPYLLTVFFFIFINNLMGIVPFFPGGANVTGNIAVTLVLALFTFVIVNVFGTKEYWKEIFWPDVPMWLKVPIPIMPAIEIVGMITKPFALMIRLFANILAGHSIVLGLTCVIFLTAQLGAAMSASMSVVSVVMTIFIDFVELLVAFIQAYVFTILSAVFIGLSQVESHHAKEVKVKD